MIHVSSQWLTDECQHWLFNNKSSPLVGDTVCNHTADSCSHTLLQSGRSPRRNNTQDMPAAGTGCTGHSCVCIQSLIATICLSAAAVCSLNSQKEKETHCSTPPIIWLVLQAQINQLADKGSKDFEKNSLVSSQA